MTKEEFLVLIGTHGNDIVEALREADRCAYRHTSCEYSVALYEDGHTEIRERIAGENWYYQNDPALIEIGSLCYQYYDVLMDNLASDELLDLLESEMTEIEHTEYDRFRIDYEGTEEEEPDDWTAVKWIEENLSDLWDRVREKAIGELTTMQEAEEQYEDLICRSVEFYMEYNYEII